jgi:hypothetical protein
MVASMQIKHLNEQKEEWYNGRDGEKNHTETCTKKPERGTVWWKMEPLLGLGYKKHIVPTCTVLSSGAMHLLLHLWWQY